MICNKRGQNKVNIYTLIYTLLYCLFVKRYKIDKTKN